MGTRCVWSFKPPETAAVRAALELAGVEVANIGLVAPTLEDVFLNLVGPPSL
jgi:hypothetical protein